MHVQSCCFADLNLLLFSSPRCRRRRCCSSSLLHLSVAEAVENQSWHWALRSDKGIHCIGINLHWFPQTSLLHFNLGQVPFEFCSKAKRITIFSEMVLRDQVLNISPWAKCWRMADRHYLIEVQILLMIFWQPHLCRWQKCMIACHYGNLGGSSDLEVVWDERPVTVEVIFHRPDLIFSSSHKQLKRLFTSLNLRLTAL